MLMPPIPIKWIFLLLNISISPFYKSIIAEFKKCASNNRKILRKKLSK